MLTAPEITIAVLMNVLQVTPVGTNVNVMRLMWAKLVELSIWIMGYCKPALIVARRSGVERGMGGKKVRRIPSEKHRYHRVLATEAARESEPTL
ncbi:hypothetical protein KFU94_40555 [Chloroflexi bacterium TSY]|nr:hypothetical protein [Chloroflexi bacterium TSY]